MSHKTESATPLEAVLVATPQVFLRKNIATEEREQPDAGEGAGTKQTVYVADEVIITDASITAGYAAEHFDELWSAAEGAALTDREYADAKAMQSRADLDYVVLLNDLKGVDDGEE